VSREAERAAERGPPAQPGSGPMAQDAQPPEAARPGGLRARY